MRWWRSSVRPDGRPTGAPYARRRARWGRPADEWSEPAWGPARPDPVLFLAERAWRYRHELAPFYAALALAIGAGIVHDYAARLWPLALPLGAAVTAALLHWRADRPPERAYVLAVGGAATVWTAAAWWASPAHDWLVLTALAGAVAAGIPRWCTTAGAARSRRAGEEACHGEGRPGDGRSARQGRDHRLRPPLGRDGFA